MSSPRTWQTSSAIGFMIALVAVTLPIVLLQVSDYAIYVWLPGTSLVALLGGPGLHDKHGILSLGLGVAIDFVLYGLVATVLIRLARGHGQADG